MAQPKYAKVDPADYDRLREYEWYAGSGGHRFYARRRVPVQGGKDSLVYMHQQVIQVPDGFVIDHINHDGMDNRGANLRPATRAQNICNRKKTRVKSRSKYKGIHWNKQEKKWRARIGFDGKRRYLGDFDDEVQAAKAYDEAAKKYHGEFASLNFESEI